MVGSGAFALAALKVLEPLYEACVRRTGRLVREALGKQKEGMEQILQRAGWKKAGEVWVEGEESRYRIRRLIVTQNIHGVEKMAEAAEIAKLRLYLSLATVTGRGGRMEPLPDLDFNIVCGDALGGMRPGIQAGLLEGSQTFQAALRKVQEKVRKVREQEEAGEGVHAGTRAAAQRAINEAEEILRRETDIGAWQLTKDGVSWPIKFASVMAEGGFSLTIGNPPYLGKRNQSWAKRYATNAANLYVPCMELGLNIMRKGGRFGMIVMLNYGFAAQMADIRGRVRQAGSSWTSHFANRPDQIFESVARVEVRNCIVLAGGTGVEEKHWTTRLHRWKPEQRETLIPLTEYAQYDAKKWENYGTGIPKVGTEGLMEGLEGKLGVGNLVPRKTDMNIQRVERKPTGRYCIQYYAPGEGPPTESTELNTPADYRMRQAALVRHIGSGKLGMVWWLVEGDDFHVTGGHMGTLPWPDSESARDVEVIARRRLQRLKDGQEGSVKFHTAADGGRVGRYDLRGKHAELTDFVNQAACEVLEVPWDEVELYYQQSQRADNLCQGDMLK